MENLKFSIVFFAKNIDKIKKKYNMKLTSCEVDFILIKRNKKEDYENKNKRI